MFVGMQAAIIGSDEATCTKYLQIDKAACAGKSSQACNVSPFRSRRKIS
jgi:hypothetical protein